MASHTKAAHYIRLLDEARCNATWGDVPELIRKTKKHAPERVCLIQTAQCELSVALNGNGRPTTSASTSNLSNQLEALSTSITNESQYPEDEFQAKVCLGWVHWILNDARAAQAHLPVDIEAAFAQLDGTGNQAAGWTRVCALKAAFVKSVAQVKNGSATDAFQTCNSALPILTANSRTPVPAELKTWTELYLTQFCLLSSQKLNSSLSPTTEAEILTAFRQWSQFWGRAGAAALGGQVAAAPVPRRDVWREYYVCLSKIIQLHLPYPTTPLGVAVSTSSSRVQLVDELKNVELIYESLLLRSLSFPKAEESRAEVEEWTDLVMQNWRVLYGSDWGDPGPDGDDAIAPSQMETASRRVLAALYNAATKTFHSTRILRHLFTVHMALAEFDLAFKAFDTYMDIVTKTKARVEKTGVEDAALDNDETVLLTASECIKALCRYGSAESTEKALHVGQLVESWLEKYHVEANGDALPARPQTVDPTVLAKAWQAVGISRAKGARVSFDPATRKDLQAQAVMNFRRALSPSLESTRDLATLFPLALVLAERREISAAIECARTALLPSTATSNGASSKDVHWAAERSLIPVWHLLSLLLSARHEFAVATRSCEGAFDQFKDPKVLFGEQFAFRSDHLNDASTRTATRRGAVDLMDDFEREAVLEIRMTQLTLIEVQEGPEVAVNASNELLSLYSRLFGDPMKSLTQYLDQAPKSLAPPKSSAGTIKSIRGSIFGRPAKPARKVSKRLASNPVSERTGTAAKPPSRALAIQVTSAKDETDTSHSKKSGGSLSIRRKRRPTIADGAPDTAHGHVTKSVGDPGSIEAEVAEEKETSPLVTDGSRTDGLSDLPMDATGAHTYPPWEKPSPLFSPDHLRRRHLGLLIRVWLLIAAFYRRAQMFDDASGALDEAHQLVEGLEADVSKEAQALKLMKSSGWGGGKSVEELWADVLHEQGNLELDKGDAWKAMAKFETALIHWPDHPAATVGLSNILLDISADALHPPAEIPALVLPKHVPGSSQSVLSPAPAPTTAADPPPAPGPLGYPRPGAAAAAAIACPAAARAASEASMATAASTSVRAAVAPAELSRLAARDRAFGLLRPLTARGDGWACAAAWCALARAYEDSGQLDKAREALWWCVELEDHRAVRPWSCVAAGGYVL